MIKVRFSNKQPSAPTTGIFLAMVVWTGINVVPVVMLPQAHATASWYMRGSSLSMAHFYAAYLAALFAMAFCGGGMLLLSSLAKGLPRRYRLIAAPAVIAVNALFMCFVITSWMWFCKKGLYLSIDDLVLLR